MLFICLLRDRIQNTVTTTRMTSSIAPTGTAVPMMTTLEGPEEGPGADPGLVVGAAEGTVVVGGAPLDCVVLIDAVTAVVKAPVELAGGRPVLKLAKLLRLKASVVVGTALVTLAVKSAVTSL